MAMDRLLTLMSEKKASDLCLSPGAAVQIKINGAMAAVNQQPLEPASVEHLLREQPAGGAYTPARLLGAQLVTRLPESSAMRIE